MIKFLVEEKGMLPGYAFSLSSIGVNFQVGEAVDQTQVVTARIPKSLFRKPMHK